ncbi:MAG TPA: prepilin-type N-terminal cleavage/methylation domain-containing protein [Phycisphaerales bacterium]|nr:prepilin-type N-terminal cleavage/methylation domain-containing protein [Phycisphaerales bacterium]
MIAASVHRGFTIVELLVVVAIVALLAGLLAPGLSGARESGRSAVCLSNLRQLQGANDLYANDHGGSLAPGAPDMLRNLTRWHGSRERTAEAFRPEGGTLSEHLGTTLVRECPTFAGALRTLAETGAGFERSAGGYGYNNAFAGTVRTRASDGTRPLVTDLAGAPRERFATPGATIAFADAAFAGTNGVGGVVEYSFAEPRFHPDWGESARADPSIHFRHAARSDRRANIVWLDGHASSAARTFTWSSGLYQPEAGAVGLGWPGESDSNVLFDYEPGP